MKTNPPIGLTRNNNLQFIEFTYCRDIFLLTTIRNKRVKYNPLIDCLRNISWKANQLITITTCVRGAVHKQSRTTLKHIQISKFETKRLMKQIHKLAINCLIYLVLNKTKLDNKQTPINRS